MSQAMLSARSLGTAFYMPKTEKSLSSVICLIPVHRNRPVNGYLKPIASANQQIKNLVPIVLICILAF